MTWLMRAASWLFGLALLGLSAFVALETVLRKAIHFSFEGADELGGYVLAVGSGLAFVVALADRAHIRIDLLHQRFGPRGQAAVNWLSAASMAGLGLFLVWVGRLVILDTLDYGSTAPTPWATPLIYPQALWYGALCAFALLAGVLALRATWLLATGRLAQLNRDFHPKSTQEELDEEIGDLERR